MGGGPSGVELAGTLGDTLSKWYTQMGGNPQDIRIVLLEKGAELLQDDINEHVRETALQALPRRVVPIELRFEHTVTAVEPDCIRFKYKNQADSSPASGWLAATQSHDPRLSST